MYFNIYKTPTYDPHKRTHVFVYTLQPSNVFSVPIYTTRYADLYQLVYPQRLQSPSGFRQMNGLSSTSSSGCQFVFRIPYRTTVDTNEFTISNQIAHNEDIYYIFDYLESKEYTVIIKDHFCMNQLDMGFPHDRSHGKLIATFHRN